jgi:DNA-directed RNA polymerase subunit N
MAWTPRAHPSHAARTYMAWTPRAHPSHAARTYMAWTPRAHPSHAAHPMHAGSVARAGSVAGTHSCTRWNGNHKCVAGYRRGCAGTPLECVGAPFRPRVRLTGSSRVVSTNRVPMLIPVRCFTCNGLVPYRDYTARRDMGTTESTTFRELGITRYCCRRMLLCNPRGLTDIMTSVTIGDVVCEDSQTSFLLEMRNSRVVDCK